MVIAIILHGDKVEMVRGETIAEIKPAVAKVLEILQEEKGEV